MLVMCARVVMRELKRIREVNLENGMREIEAEILGFSKIKSMAAITNG